MNLQGLVNYTHPNIIVINYMPRKKYKTITVKARTFQKFLKTIQKAKKKDIR